MVCCAAWKALAHWSQSTEASWSLSKYLSQPPTQPVRCSRSSCGDNLPADQFPFENLHTEFTDGHSSPRWGAASVPALHAPRPLGPHLLRCTIQHPLGTTRASPPSTGRARGARTGPGTAGSSPCRPGPCRRTRSAACCTSPRATDRYRGSGRSGRNATGSLKKRSRSPPGKRAVPPQRLQNAARTPRRRPEASGKRSPSNLSLVRCGGLSSRPDNCTVRSAAWRKRNREKKRRETRGGGGHLLAMPSSWHAMREP